MHTVPYEGSVGPGEPAHHHARPAQGLQDAPGPLRARRADGLRHAAASRRSATRRSRATWRSTTRSRTFLDEGGTVYACRFASGALYGFPENLLMEGVKPFHPLDVLDSALTAWREKAFQLNTWTV